MSGCIALGAAGSVFAAMFTQRGRSALSLLITPAGTTDILARIIGQK